MYASDSKSMGKERDLFLLFGVSLLPEKIYIRLHDSMEEKSEEILLITPSDVPSAKLIERLAKHFKENVDLITPPSWAAYVKTGSHVEKQPQNPDWWFIRCASLLRKIYVHGPVGIAKLRPAYGGRRSQGVKSEHAQRAGGTIVRKSLQQLEAAGLVETLGSKGRRVTREGRKLLQEMSEEVYKELTRQLPEMEKYQTGE